MNDIVETITLLEQEKMIKIFNGEPEEPSWFPFKIKLLKRGKEACEAIPSEVDQNRCYYDDFFTFIKNKKNDWDGANSSDDMIEHFTYLMMALINSEKELKDDERILGLIMVMLWLKEKIRQEEIDNTRYIG